MFKRNGCHVDLWADMRWDLPACLMNDTGVTLPGAPRREGTGIYGMHFLTPETETTSYYHFAAVRWNPISWGEPVDTEIREKIADLRRYAFEFQDQGIIRAQQEMMVQFPNETRKPIFLETDVGPARYKRILERKLSEEQDRAAGLSSLAQDARLCRLSDAEISWRTWSHRCPISK